MKKNNFSESDRDLAVGFILFVFVKTYQDTFLYSIPRIIKIAYENQLLLRYSFLIVLLLVYNFLPIIIISSSFFQVELLQTQVNILKGVFCVSLFVLIKYYFPNIITLNCAILSVSTTYITLLIFLDSALWVWNKIFLEIFFIFFTLVFIEKIN